MRKSRRSRPAATWASSPQAGLPVRRLTRHMWLRYWLAVALIAGLSLASYWVVINLNLLNENNGKRLQAGARQQALAEQAGRLGLALALPQEEAQRLAARERLRQTLAELAALRDGGGLLAVDDQQAAAALDARLLEFNAAASRLLNQAEFAAPAALAGEAARLAAAVDGLAPALREQAKAYEQDGVGKLYTAIETETYVAALTLAVLALEMLFIFRPIIGRVRHTAASLQQQASFNRDIIATTQAFIAGLDANGQVVLFNRHGEEKTGWAEAELAGRHFAEHFLPPERQAEFATLVGELFTGHRDGGEYEAPCLARTGEVLTVRWQLTAAREPATGQPLLVLATGADLTVEKAAAQRLEAALRETQSLGERLRQEVAHAAVLQRSLLPAPDIALPGLAGAAALATCTEVGGDYYDYYSVGGRYAVAVVADASGHGVAAGSLVNAAKIAILQAAERGETDPARILALANRALLATTHDSMFMTMGCLCLDGATGALRYASAGHVFPYVFDRDGGWQALETSGLPLGRVADAEYRNETLALQPGDRLFLYTDGLIEEQSPQGEAFGFERLERLLEEYGGLPCAEAVQWMQYALEQHREAQALGDDLTLLALEHTHRVPADLAEAVPGWTRLSEADYRAGPPDPGLSRQHLVFMPQEAFADHLPRLCRDGVRRVLPEQDSALAGLGLAALLAQQAPAALDDLHRLVGHCDLQRQFLLAHSDDKGFIHSELAGLLAGQVDAAHAEALLFVFDELVENALYGAPQDRDGRPLHAKGTPRRLAGRDSVRLDFALAGRWLGLMLTDAWGTLTPAVFLRRLALNSRLEGLQAGAGGAGLFLSWHWSDYLQIRVTPRRQTQITVLWDLAAAPDFETAPGFQFFYHSEADECGEPAADASLV